MFQWCFFEHARNIVKAKNIYFLFFLMQHQTQWNKLDTNNTSSFTFWNDFAVYLYLIFEKSTNICSKKKYTNCRSVLLLRLVYFFSEQILGKIKFDELDF